MVGAKQQQNVCGCWMVKGNNRTKTLMNSSDLRARVAAPLRGEVRFSIEDVGSPPALTGSDSNVARSGTLRQPLHSIFDVVISCCIDRLVEWMLW